MTTPRQPGKRKLSGAEFKARFEAEQALQLERYGAALALWRRCGSKRCLRDATCRGDISACLKRSLAAVPHRAQWQARQDILAATPGNIGAPERAARTLMPAELDAAAVAAAVARYLAYR
jgi:muconolactone delta-isomerase